ncbi:hypothetical protein BN134_700 [Cronobacter dublinensis 1210]|uniref:Uncharacterized protein n=1 Tax=Cronobacter dublinensis 1210 TaxID=1208656 RepID=A0ABP1W4Y0_9ENTR|nr:hypothetical protein BN134_700 [Cronobacter dublinensis 1210]
MLLRRYILPQSAEKRTVIIHHVRFFTQRSLRLRRNGSRASLLA